MTEMPVYQASKPNAGTVAYQYVVGTQAARQAASNGWELECVAFASEDAPGTNLLEFKRYTLDGFVFYTTDPAAESLNGWTARAASTTAYLGDPDPGIPATIGAVNLARYVNPSDLRAHFWTADTVHNPAPAGWSVGPTGRTGWVRPVTRVEFQVEYNGNGESSGVTVTGGNATGTCVEIDGSDYTMKADDALVGYGIGNWIRYSKTGSGNWHFQGVTVAGVGSHASFETITYPGDTRIALVDNDLDNTNTDIAYEYTLHLFDVARDKVVDFDPKIINRSPMGGGGPA